MVIVLEFDTNTAFYFRWSNTVKGFALGWFAINFVNCNLGEFACLLAQSRIDLTLRKIVDLVAVFEKETGMRVKENKEEFMNFLKEG